MDTVARYGRYEMALSRTSKTGFPYTETELTAVCTRPDGSRLEVYGFYDGGDTWRVRVMPDQTGQWTVDAAFAGGGARERAAFECVDEGLPGMITKDLSNPMWFGYSSGAHFFMRSFHVGDCFFAANWPDENRRAFLDWAQAQGYNTLSIASFFVNRQTYKRGMGWDTPQLWPLNAEAYQEAERILDDLWARGIVVFPFAGFFGREGFNPNAHRDQALYIRYTIARWGSYSNLLFNVAGPEPILDANPFMPRCEVDKLGHMIAVEDPYGHLLTVHNQTTHDQFALAPYRTFSTMQGPKTVSLEVLANGLLRSHPAEGPLYAQETLWTDNIHGHPQYTDDELRRNAYAIALTASSLNYGDMSGDSSSGFSGVPDLERRSQWRHDIVRMVWDVVSQFPYYAMRPDSAMAPGGHCLSGEGCALVYADRVSGIRVQLPPAEGDYAVRILRAANPTEERVERAAPGEAWIALDEREDFLIYFRAEDGKA